MVRAGYVNALTASIGAGGRGTGSGSKSGEGRHYREGGVGSEGDGREAKKK